MKNKISKMWYLEIDGCVKCEKKVLSKAQEECFSDYSECSDGVHFEE